MPLFFSFSDKKVLRKNVSVFPQEKVFLSAQTSASLRKEMLKTQQAYYL